MTPRQLSDSAAPGATPDPAERPFWRLVHDRLRGRWRAALVSALVLAPILALAGYLAAPRRFTSEGRIHVRSSGRAILRPTEETRLLPNYEALLHTQALLVATPRVIDAALDDPAVAALPFAGTDGARERILENLSAEPERRSELIAVGYESADPDEAQTVVNAVLRAFETIHGDRVESFRRHREEQLVATRNDLRRQLNMKQQAIDRFIADSDYGGANLAAVLERTMLRIEESRQQLEHIAAVSSNREAQESGGQVASATAEQLARIDPELPAMHRELVDLRSQLDQAEGRYHESHFFIRRLTERIDLIEQQIEARERVAREQWATVSIARSDDGRATAMSAQEFEGRRERLAGAIQSDEEEARRVSAQHMHLQGMLAELVELDGALAEVNQAIRGLHIEAAAEHSGRTTVVEWGSRPLLPSRDRRLPFTAAGGLAGLGLGLGSFFLVGIARPRTWNTRQIGERFGAHACLGAIPRLEGSFERPGALEEAVRCAHSVRNRIEARRDPAWRVIAVTSAESGDGKTALALALGWSYAISGCRTLLVDCDLEGRSLTRQIGLAGEVGLREALRNRHLNGEVRHCGQANLDAIGVGNDDAVGPESIRADSLGPLCKEMRDAFDLVIVDTGPLGCVESLPVLAAADAVVLTTRRGRSWTRFEQCLEELRAVGTPCLGVVLNAADLSDCRRYVSTSRTPQPALCPPQPGPGSAER